MKTWRWPIQVYTQAETRRQAMDIMVDALNDTFGVDGWTTDQPAVDDGEPE